MSNNEYLEHHGILGQKWGVRRYQNADGSLTEAGRKRYLKLSKEKDRAEEKVRKTEEAANRYANRSYFLRDEDGFTRRQMRVERAKTKYNKISDKIQDEYKDVSLDEVKKFNLSESERSKQRKQLKQSINRNDSEALANAAPKRLGKHFYQGNPDLKKYSEYRHRESDKIREKIKNDPDLEKAFEKYFSTYDDVQDLMKTNASRAKVEKALEKHVDAGKDLEKAQNASIKKYEKELLSAGLKEIGEEDTAINRELLKEIYNEQHNGQWWLM